MMGAGRVAWIISLKRWVIRPEEAACRGVLLTVDENRQSLLRERFEVGTGTAMVFTWVVVILVIFVFWRGAAQTPLLLWGGFKIVFSVSIFGMRSRAPEFKNWYRSELVLQAIAGTAWGMVAVVAMPTEPVQQTMLVAVLAGVVIASSVGESQFRGLYMAFLLPVASTVTFAYFVYPGGLREAGILYLCAIVYAFVASSDDRRLHHRLVDMSIENQTLLAKTAEDRDVLASLNNSLDRLAWRDELTGLANRAAATARLSELLRETVGTTRPVTLAYLDLDGFKQVNDTFGHGVGDKLLQIVARRLSDRVDEAELVCRFGGDEMVVISETHDISDLGSRLAAAFEQPMRIGGQTFNAVGSIGIASICHPGSADELLRRADQALYHHKRSVDRAPWSQWDDDERGPVPALRSDVDKHSNTDKRSDTNRHSDIEKHSGNQVHTERHKDGEIQQARGRHDR